MINVHVIKPWWDWEHGALDCFLLHMPPASNEILQNWKFPKVWIRAFPSEKSQSCLLRPPSARPLWRRAIKPLLAVSAKWKRSLNVLFSASQRGEAYSTPWNWCLINLPFLMWDVVTWSYFFPSLSAERRTQASHTWFIFLPWVIL